MAPSTRFANYPGAKEGPSVPYKREDDKNPPMRGYPIVLGGELVARSAWLQKYLWRNAGFGRVRTIPDINEYQWRLSPTVIPLAEPGASTNVEIGPELYKRQSIDLAGRYHSAADYHELYKSGTLTPLQVVNALLPLIRRDQKPAAKYSCSWVHSDVDLVTAAAKASTERYANGKPLSILDGVPFGAKDDCDVKGYISHVGMQYSDTTPFFSPAKETIWPVKKLEEAGAIMIGKNVMHELGSDPSGCNPRWGTPTNWFNKDYFPGGSSSGAGSACGVGLVPITVGTDAGGSVRFPPCFNGVYGFKVSQHRTRTMTSNTCVTGPMCATVDDLTIAYRLMAQPNPDDPTQGQFAASIPPSPSAKKIMGIYRDWFNESRPDVVDACNKAIKYMTENLNYEVVDISIPYLREGQLSHSATCLAEMATLGTTRTPDPANWLTILNSPNKILMNIGAQTSAVDLAKYGQLRDLLMRHLASLYEKYPGMIIVTPTCPVAGWKKHPGDDAYGFSDGNSTVYNMMYIWLANFCGNPAVTCPIGYGEPEQGEGRLPIGLMGMAIWGGEEECLAWAKDTETYLNNQYPGGRLRPKEWADVIGLATSNDSNGV